MKKASILLGLGLLGTILLSFTSTYECEELEDCETLPSLTEANAPAVNEGHIDPNGEIVKISDISYIEERDEIELGFDTSEYLPLGFNAYEGMEFDLDDIVYLEEEEDIEVQNHLPENFKAVTK